MINVLAVVPHPQEGPSSRLRVYQFAGPLQSYGINLTLSPFISTDVYRSVFLSRKHSRYTMRSFCAVLKGLATRTAQVLQSGNYQAILIHQNASPVISNLVHKMFCHAASPILYDFDDAVFERTSVDGLLRHSAVAIAGNSFLKEYAIGAGARSVRELPTVADTDRYGPWLREETGPPVVGWIGTRSTFERYVRNLLPSLITSCHRAGATLRIIGPPSISAEVVKSGAEFVPWRLDDEWKQVAQFSVGIMPLTNDCWSKGKCAWKLIQYGAVGVPCIASDVGANKDVVVHGENGFLAEDDGSFCSYLEQLCSVGELRARMGALARQRIEESYSLRRATPIWAESIREAVG